MALADVRRDRPWTYADLKELPDDGRRWEIIDGELVEMTGPTSPHMIAVFNLIRELQAVVGGMGGMLLGAPLDVMLPGGHVVEPDLLVTLPGGPARLSMRGLEGPPDLVVEVLSPSNRRHDTVTKRALYGRTGVREYWIVDPESRTIERLEPVESAMLLRRRFAADEAFASPLLPGMAFPVATLFAGFDLIDDAPTTEEA